MTFLGTREKPPSPKTCSPSGSHVTHLRLDFSFLFHELALYNKKCNWNLLELAWVSFNSILTPLFSNICCPACGVGTISPLFWNPLNSCMMPWALTFPDHGSNRWLVIYSRHWGSRKCSTALHTLLPHQPEIPEVHKDRKALGFLFILVPKSWESFSL